MTIDGDTSVAKSKANNACLLTTDLAILFTLSFKGFRPLSIGAVSLMNFSLFTYQRINRTRLPIMDTTTDKESKENINKQVLGIGDHYLVRRSDNSWRK